MKIIILIFYLVIGIRCEDKKFTKLAAADKKYLIKLDAQQKQDIQCLKRLDAILTSKWTAEEKKIPTGDLSLGEIPTGDSVELDKYLVTNPLYHTKLEQWLMTGDSTPSQKLEKCMRKTIDKVTSLLTVNDIECLNEMFESHIIEEQEIERDFLIQLKNSIDEQLPFRYFLNFREFVEMMFQNRNPDALSAMERGVYEHLENHLSTEKDKDRKVFVMLRECSWKRAIALREVPNSKAKYKEFISQVRNLVDWQLGKALTSERYSGALNMTLIIQKHSEWLKSRNAMGIRLTEEVRQLRTQQRDAQWLCEYAFILSRELFQEQLSILEIERLKKFPLEILETGSRVKNIEEILKKEKDIRHHSVHKLRTDIDGVSLCLEGFVDAVLNHHDIAVVSAFAESHHSFQKTRCGRADFNLYAIDNRVCNCVGSFCVTHGLAVLNPTHYDIVRGKDGLYKIVPSRKLENILEVEKNISMKNSNTTMNYHS